MNVVDSSGWLEYFTGGSNASIFASAIEKTSDLIVPTVCILEVFKKILREHGRDLAVEKIAYMKLGEIIPLDESLAMEAAELSLQTRLPMADSIILATAQRYSATVWTQDDDFKGIPGVKYWPKNARK